MVPGRSGDHSLNVYPQQHKEPYMSTRYFEFVQGTSSKFYEVGVNGNGVTVRYGRIGAEGQILVKNFPDAAAAAHHADQLIAKKVAKGYLEAVIH